MDVARPASRLTCPSCGTVQQSPGSTVCEECGHDLPMVEPPTAPSPSGISRSAAVRRPGQAAASLRTVAAIPVRVVRRIVGVIAAVFSLILRIVSITLRTLLIVLVVAAVVLGLSYLPAVQAKVPAATQLPGMSLRLLRSGADLGSRWLRSLLKQTPPPLEASRPAGVSPAPRASKPTSAASTPTAPKPAAVKPAASKPAASTPAAAAVPTLTVRSAPQGATVLLNQRRVGRTPMTIKVAPGTYKVTISRSGYKSVTRTVTVKAKTPTAIDVVLTMAP